jgi:hypothetical protein
MEKKIEEKSTTLKDTKIKELLEAGNTKMESSLSDPNAIDSKKIKNLEEQVKAKNEELEVLVVNLK